MTAAASDRVRAEWQARISAEYTSAAVTQHLGLWIIQLGAPPELIEASVAIVGDELAHSRLSHEVYLDAGGGAGPTIDRAHLGLVPTGSGLEIDVLRVGVQSFCLGETVAVPLFRHLREGCTVPSARTALDRILRDEVRHREFGWDLLDWLLATPLGDRVPGLLATWLPAMFAGLEDSYGRPHQDSPDAERAGGLDADRAWGLAPPHEYGEILARCIDRDYRPRLAARGLDDAAAIAAGWGSQHRP